MAVDDKIKWYFGFRVAFPQGKWVLLDGYDTQKEAKEARERAKATDCDVTEIMAAASLDEAKKILHIKD